MISQQRRDPHKSPGWKRSEEHKEDLFSAFLLAQTGHIPAPNSQMGPYQEDPKSPDFHTKAWCSSDLLLWQAPKTSNLKEESLPLLTASTFIVSGWMAIVHGPASPKKPGRDRQREAAHHVAARN